MEIKGFSQCIAANKQQACGLAAAASCGMVAACEFFICKLVLLLLVAATLRLLVAATMRLLVAASLRLLVAAKLQLIVWFKHILFHNFYITKVHTCKHYQSKRIGTKAKNAYIVLLLTDCKDVSIIP